MNIDPISTIVTVITIFSVVYTAIAMKKTGVTVFLLQIQTPISIAKRWLKLGGERQNFLKGAISHPVTDWIFEQLIALGYQWDYFAYHDDGEIISMRKLYGNRQIHVRVFDDGEIRIHDELNYEFEPIKHMQEPEAEADVEEVNKVLLALGANHRIDNGGGITTLT